MVAREEERRRLRRDLHDGVGPSLAALALHVETARDIAADDPEAARSCSTGWCHGSTRQSADVRALVHELRPPMLDELGLAAAVRELGAAVHGYDEGRRCRAGEIAGCLPLWRSRRTGSPVRRLGTRSGTRAPGRVAVRVREVDGCVCIRSPTTDAACPTGARPGSVRRRCGSGLRSSAVSCGSTPVRRARR